MRAKSSTPLMVLLDYIDVVVNIDVIDVELHVTELNDIPVVINLGVAIREHDDFAVVAVAVARALAIRAITGLSQACDGFHTPLHYLPPVLYEQKTYLLSERLRFSTHIIISNTVCSNKRLRPCIPRRQVTRFIFILKCLRPGPFSAKERYYCLHVGTLVNMNYINTSMFVGPKT